MVLGVQLVHGHPNILPYSVAVCILLTYHMTHFTHIIILIVRCTCTKCETMMTAVECRCCFRVDRVREKMEDYDETRSRLGCITEHPGFHTVCLDSYVLETAYLQYRQQYGERDGDDVNRYITLRDINK